MFGITILGNNSALPAHNRHPTAQAVTIQGEVLLIDCGEAAQMQLRQYKVRFSKLNHIYISHLHGDHYFGLPGLLTTFSLLGRTKPLTIYAPPLLEEVLNKIIRSSYVELGYPLHFYSLVKEEVITNKQEFTVRCFQVAHRIECWGFCVEEKKNPRKIDLERVQQYNVPKTFYEELQQGENYITPEGALIPNEELTVPNIPSKSYAYCADTAFFPPLSNKIKNATLLYHEATYLNELEMQAAQRFHSTTAQAATIAKMAQAQRLLIGHFSSKYAELNPFLLEAQQVFPFTELAQEGVTYLV